MNEQHELRKHVLELLAGKSAHIDIESGVKDFPADRINTRPENSPHSAWDLLEHLRLAQWDILEFSRNPKHVSPEFPGGYWPKIKGTTESWTSSLSQILSDLQTMRDLVADGSTDLLAPFPHGQGQTLLREALLIVDHNAYHLGQIVFIKKIFLDE
ncbi:MAG: DinB family protein [Pyrinomonadaceae bacterium]